MGSPSLVFADEPTGNLDAKNAKHLMDEFLGLLSRQTDGQNPALVLATHNIEVARLADKMMILEDGFLQSTAPSDGRRSS
ncbi:MAG: hypothetical protein HY547_01700 [Elusimicrobia bacterium]|nr:hypothetical protein [Elusimicrobiota bacterium]